MVLNLTKFMSDVNFTHFLGHALINNSLFGLMQIHNQKQRQPKLPLDSVMRLQYSRQNLANQPHAHVPAYHVPYGSIYTSCLFPD